MDAMRTFSCWPRSTAGSSDVALFGYPIRSITPASDSSHLSIGPISHCDHRHRWATAITAIATCDESLSVLPNQLKYKGVCSKEMAALQRLSGKVAVVTGATSGIGLAIAQRFVDERWKLVNDRLDKVFASYSDRELHREVATHRNRG